MLAYRWEDNRGRVHLIPTDGCMACENHLDVWMDPLKDNEIYYVDCEYQRACNEDATPVPGSCPYFELAENLKNKIPIKIDKEG